MGHKQLKKLLTAGSQMEIQLKKIKIFQVGKSCSHRLALLAGLFTVLLLLLKNYLNLKNDF